MEKYISFSKHWKAISIVIAIVTIAITGTILIMNKDIQYNFLKPIETEDIIDQGVKEFLISDKRKLRDILLTQELFEKLEPPEGHVIYYFPEECPDYTKDILLIEDTEYGNKYFLPEKNSLVKISKEHKWTKEFRLFWKKSPSETIIYNIEVEQSPK